jgi:voltage-dependent calcium channel T type alpha-1G
VLDVFNIAFTLIFLIEAIVRIVALGFKRYFQERWNQLDMFIVVLSIAGIFFDKLNTKAIPINPTIIRVMRVLRIARGSLSSFFFSFFVSNFVTKNNL